MKRQQKSGEERLKAAKAGGDRLPRGAGTLEAAGGEGQG